MGNVARLFVLLIVVVVSCAGLNGGPVAAGSGRLSAGRCAPRTRRVIVYVRGTPAEIDDQLRECAALCAERGYTVVGVVRELPGATDGIAEAHRMVRRGEADEIVVASAMVLPDLLESATGSLPGRWVRGRRRPAHRRRIWPTRRDDEGA